MRIDEILSFDEYWDNRRFLRKKPVMTGTTHLRYGDNIYHHDGENTYCQVDSFHSLPNGGLSRGDLKRDTGSTDRVLLGRDFAYWGRRGVSLPDSLKYLIKKGPSHKRIFSDAQVNGWLSWLAAHGERGYIDEPAHWQFLANLKSKRKRK